MKKLIALIISVILSFTLVTSCKKTDGDGGLGGLSLTSFALVETSVDKEYIIGDEVDFSNIQVNIKYSDASYNKTLGFSDLTLTYAQNLTASAGEKTVTFKYVDTVLNNATREGSFIVKVYRSVYDFENYEVVEYTDPVALTARKNVINKAGTASHGDAEFSGQFFSDETVDTTYYVGDDNVFKFVPSLTVLDENYEEEVLPMFRSSVKISVKVENVYQELTANAIADTDKIEYALGAEVLVTVDTIKNEYQFATNGNAIGKEFKIEVVPATNYGYTGSKVSTIEVKVIDAFNVYKAKDLSVIDNVQDVWATKKQEWGLQNVTVAGVVLHDDITILESDVPDELFHQAEKTVTFTDGTTSQTINAGDKVLKDHAYLYERNQNGNFAIQGNYFTISVAQLPVVGANVVFNDTNPESSPGYGGDYSNSALFCFEGMVESTETNDFINYTVENLSLIGNAFRNELQYNGEPLSGGGLVMFKGRKAVSNLNNVISNSFFIAYMPHSEKTTLSRSIVNLNHIKCYDSYQNAGFIWNNGEVNASNSYIENSGGPLFIIQDGEGDTHAENSPALHLTNTVAKSLVQGEEFWFKAMNADQKVKEIKPLNGLLEGIAAATKDTPLYVNKSMVVNDKMNVIAVTMGQGDITSAIGNPATRGVVTIDTFVHNREDATYRDAAFEGVLAMGAPALKVDTTSGPSPMLAYMGENPSVEAMMAFIPGFTSSKYIAVNQLGFGLILELYEV